MSAGDMDSIDLRLLDRLKNTDTTIIRTPDQEHTDYTKALKQLRMYAENKRIQVRPALHVENYFPDADHYWYYSVTVKQYLRAGRDIR